MFDVVVSRPWHTSVVIRDVRVPATSCGIERSAVVEAHLSLLPDAPPVRQVVTPPYGYAFGQANLTDKLQARVVAAEGVSQEVTWIARDTSVIRLAPDGSMTTRCRTQSGHTWAVASSVVDPTKQDSIRVSVAADVNRSRCP